MTALEVAQGLSIAQDPRPTAAVVKALAQLLRVRPAAPTPPIAASLFSPAADSLNAIDASCEPGLAPLSALIDAAFADSNLGPLHPATLTAAAHGRIQRAVHLLGQVMPEVAEPALNSVSVGVCMRNDIPSMYLSMTPEVIYVGDRMIERESWELADALLHECLHDQTETMRQVRFLLRSKYHEDRSKTTLLPWSLTQPRPRYFSTWRLLSACHVYVHLSAFRRSLKLDPSVTSEPLRRARFMIDALLSEPHAADLGRDGESLVAWLADVTTRMERITNV